VRGAGLVTYIGPNEAIASPDHQAFLSVPSKVESQRYGYERIATKHLATKEEDLGLACRQRSSFAVD
jgi:hypothetical protein